MITPAPFVLRHRPVLKIGRSIVVHATGRFLVRYFQNDLTLKVKGKLVCQWRQLCRTVTGNSKHESFKRFCNYCKKKEAEGHFFYVVPLKPSKLTDRFVYVFFDTECTQDLMGPLSIYRTSCTQQMCSNCEAVRDLSVDCRQCDKRTILVWA